MLTIHVDEFLTATGKEGATQLHLGTADYLGGTMENKQDALLSNSSKPLGVKLQNAEPIKYLKG